MAGEARWLLGERGTPPATAEEARALLRRAAARRASAAAAPLSELFALLGRLRRSWRDPDYAPRRALQEALPGACGLSAEAVQDGLRGLDWVLDPSPSG